MLDDKSLTDAQKEQIMVCAEIGIECSNSEPEKRPSDTKEIMDRLEKAGSTQVWSKVKPCNCFSIMPKCSCCTPLPLLSFMILQLKKKTIYLYFNNSTIYV